MRLADGVIVQPNWLARFSAVVVAARNTLSIEPSAKLGADRSSFLILSLGCESYVLDGTRLR